MVQPPGTLCWYIVAPLQIHSLPTLSFYCVLCKYFFFHHTLSITVMMIMMWLWWMCHQVRRTVTWWKQPLTVRQRQQASATATDWCGLMEWLCPLSDTRLSPELYGSTFPTFTLNRCVCWCVCSVKLVCLNAWCDWFSGEQERGFSDRARYWQWQWVMLQKEKNTHHAFGGTKLQTPPHSEDHESGEGKRRIWFPAKTREAGVHKAERWDTLMETLHP